MEQRAGSRLGNYHLVRLLGRGGFADVYLGQHIHLQTQAAVKVLSRPLGGEEVAAFKAEARTIAGLAHSHIVRLLDFNVEEAVAYFVMDYAPGGTLRERHAPGTRLRVPQLLAYMRQVTAAVQYAHAARVIHRDIKPENLLLGKSGEVLLSDFGIALLATSSSKRVTQNMAGTVGYMAPEQLQGKPQRASDQYALGIMLYEWLCGERPFRGSWGEVVAQHLSTPPARLAERVPTIAPELEEVVLTALAKDPRQRFASVAEFAAALELAAGRQHSPRSAFLLPAPTTITHQAPAFGQRRETPALIAPPPGESATGDRFATAQPPGGPTTSTRRDTEKRARSRGPSRRALLVGIVGLAASSGAIGGLVAAFLQRPTHPGSSLARRSPSPLPTTHPQRGPALASPTPTGSPPPKPSPSPTPTPPPGSTLLTYRGHSSVVTSLAWSPDGTRIASASSDGSVQVWSATSGSRLLTYRGHTGPVNAVAWSPDGARIASGGADATVQVWSASTGHPLLTYRGTTIQVNAVAWSPDGNTIASGGLDQVVQVWSAASGGTLISYHGHGATVYTIAWSPNAATIASGSGDQTAQVWSAASGSNLYTYRGHSSLVSGVAWSPNGARIASCSLDQTVQVWDATTGGDGLTYTGHSSSVYCVGWSPDGARIASGSLDQTVRVWNAATAANLLAYRGHADYVYCLKWSPDGARIASGSADRTVQVWQSI